MIIKKVILIISIFLYAGCSLSKEGCIKEVYTNLYESYSADSINIALSTNQIPITIAKGEEYDTLILDKNVIIISAEGHNFDMITETPNYYLICVSEYIVGYDIIWVHDKKNGTLYQTDLYNFIQEPYKIQYETCDFAKCKIDIIYYDKSIEHVRFNKCASDTVRFRKY